MPTAVKLRIPEIINFPNLEFWISERLNLLISRNLEIAKFWFLDSSNADSVLEFAKPGPQRFRSRGTQGFWIAGIQEQAWFHNRRNSGFQEFRIFRNCGIHSFRMPGLSESHEILNAWKLGFYKSWFLNSCTSISVPEILNAGIQRITNPGNREFPFPGMPEKTSSGDPHFTDLRISRLWNFPIEEICIDGIDKSRDSWL